MAFRDVSVSCDTYQNMRGNATTCHNVPRSSGSLWSLQGMKGSFLSGWLDPFQTACALTTLSSIARRTFVAGLTQYPSHRAQHRSSLNSKQTTLIKMAAKSKPPEGKYPAKAHCEKVAEFLKNRGASMDGMLYLEGARQQNWEDSDCEAPFRSASSPPRLYYTSSACTQTTATLLLP